MICPSCGTHNPEDSGHCSHCGYKFRFGHAYNDPRYMRIINFLKPNSKISKGIGYLFVSLLVIIFILVILSWLNSI